jgi:predicted glycosyltransferase
MPIPRLDLLIYAHDGRGLGHASRSVAVGMAFRRLFPEATALFVSGAGLTSELIGSAPLDWIKLPSYATRVIGGQSTGQSGPSNYSDSDLGNLRSETLAHLVRLLRPHCILADHMPQGKHKELRPALEASLDLDTRWVLGVRAMVGAVPGVWSDLAQSLFRRHYRAVLWYGDSRVLGSDQLRQLAAQFDTEPVETGYVSRLAELQSFQPVAHNPNHAHAGTISIPWMGEHTAGMIEQLAGALERIGGGYGRWHLYIGLNRMAGQATPAIRRIGGLAWCSLHPPGGGYAESLLNSKTALIYGGYNSLSDVLYARLPAVVVLRGMVDAEQQAHVARLIQMKMADLTMVEENQVTAAGLAEAFQRLLAGGASNVNAPNLCGAETAARVLHGFIHAQNPPPFAAEPH